MNLNNAQLRAKQLVPGCPGAAAGGIELVSGALLRTEPDPRMIREDGAERVGVAGVARREVAPNRVNVGMIASCRRSQAGAPDEQRQRQARGASHHRFDDVD